MQDDEPDYGAWMQAYMQHLDVQVRGGHGWVKVRCPFHDDAHASAVVQPQTGHFKCFGCDAAGGVIKLVQYGEGVDVGGAFRFVEEVLRQPVGQSHSNNGSGRVSARSRVHTSGRGYVPPRRRTYGGDG